MLRFEQIRRSLGQINSLMDLPTEGQAEREVKWHIWPDADEGKGFAFEAARAVLGHVFGAMGWETAVSYIAHGNERSAALARRLGAVQDGTWVTPRGTEVRVFRHGRGVVA